MQNDHGDYRLGMNGGIGDGVDDGVPRPGRPIEGTISQSTQLWVGDVAVVFAQRDGDVAVLAVHGERVEWHVVNALIGETVQAGPYALTVTGLEYDRDRDRDLVSVRISTLEA
jgi:hypothetical protein